MVWLCCRGRLRARAHHSSSCFRRICLCVPRLPTHMTNSRMCRHMDAAKASQARRSNGAARARCNVSWLLRPVTHHGRLTEEQRTAMPRRIRGEHRQDVQRTDAHFTNVSKFCSNVPRTLLALNTSVRDDILPAGTCTTLGRSLIIHSQRQRQQWWRQLIRQDTRLTGRSDGHGRSQTRGTA